MRRPTGLSIGVFALICALGVCTASLSCIFDPIPKNKVAGYVLFDTAGESQRLAVDVEAGYITAHDSTNAEGYFEVEYLPAGEYTVTVTGADVVILGSPLTVTIPGNDTPLSFMAVPTFGIEYSISGRAYMEYGADEHGDPITEPIPGLLIGIVQPGEWADTMTTWSDGRFYFPVPGPGDYTVAAEDTRNILYDSDQADTRTLSESNPQEEINFRFTPDDTLSEWQQQWLE